MMSYLKIVSNNILPLSEAASLPHAFKEWRFTENTIDHLDAVETCRLCEKEGLRYHFEIANRLTQNVLMVGSHCILKFGVAVFEDGNLLSLPEAKKKLHRLTEQLRLDSCINALKNLASKENTGILKGWS